VGGNARVAVGVCSAMSELWWFQRQHAWRSGVTLATAVVKECPANERGLVGRVALPWNKRRTYACNVHAAGEAVKCWARMPADESQTV